MCFRPGQGAHIHLTEQPEGIGVVDQGFGELLLNLIPENPFAAMANGDVLPVIFFSLLFGFFVTQLKTDQRNLMGGFFRAAFEAMMKLTSFVIWTAPIGVFGIIAGIVAQTGFEAFASLGKFFLVVMAGLAIHFFITLPLLLKYLGKLSPIKHYRGMLSALMTAFSTCSTIVTLPLTMKAVTETSGASERLPALYFPSGPPSTWTARPYTNVWPPFSLPRYMVLTWEWGSRGSSCSLQSWPPSGLPAFP
jgi:proton glutamate symport protein